ncbi:MULTISPECIES: hypothetical protein [Vibrio]|uniref:hypothetical protein n=1 Tax=Vibrio TaxID=662 RepID=UPI00114C958C|nr:MULTISPECIES: hypothetical protein [Vibrio]USD58626.1 hypothetical protein J4N44_27115 [Vibrio sp. SCSIO 43155]
MAVQPSTTLSYLINDLDTVFLALAWTPETQEYIKQSLSLYGKGQLHKGLHRLVELSSDISTIRVSRNHNPYQGSKGLHNILCAISHEARECGII